MSAPRARQNGVPGSRSQAGSHQLIALQLLLTAQAAHGFTERIVGDAALRLDGWFHGFLGFRNSGLALPSTSFGAKSLSRQRLCNAVVLLPVYAFVTSGGADQRAGPGKLNLTVTCI